MLFKDFKKAVSEQVRNQKTAKDTQQAFDVAEKSNDVFEAKKQQILQEMGNGSRRSNGKLPV